jgi:hypothetical protein
MHITLQRYKIPFYFPSMIKYFLEKTRRMINNKINT